MKKLAYLSAAVLASGCVADLPSQYEHSDFTSAFVRADSTVISRERVDVSWLGEQRIHFSYRRCEDGSISRYPYLIHNDTKGEVVFNPTMRRAGLRAIQVPDGVRMRASYTSPVACSDDTPRVSFSGFGDATREQIDWLDR